MISFLDCRAILARPAPAEATEGDMGGAIFESPAER